MSAQKWESVTWDWIEREIVDYLLIAGDRSKKFRGKSLPRLLARRPARVNVPPQDMKRGKTEL